VEGLITSHLAVAGAFAGAALSTLVGPGEGKPGAILGAIAFGIVGAILEWRLFRTPERS